MKCTKDNWEDVKKYYESTFVKLPETGERVFKIVEVNSKGIRFYDYEGGEEEYTFEEPCQLDYILPHKKTFQWKGNAFLLTRTPARMWKKGLSEKNTKFFILGAFGWTTCEFSMSLYGAFVNKPNYLTYKDALMGIKEGTLDSAAISSRVSISSKKTVFVDTTPVGKVFPSKKTVLVYNKLFIDVLSPLFHGFEVSYAGT